MPNPINPHELAKLLSPEQFEFLLRSYCEAQLTSLNKNPGAIMFWIDTGYGTVAELKETHWQIGVGSNTTITKGEILASVSAEHNRRNNFDQSCKLALLEHEPSI